MGYSQYDQQARSVRSITYSSQSREEIFSQTRIHESMNPKNINFRESRDSEAHPNSIAIIIGLDVTGSMGRIPEMLIKNHLPKLISSLMEKGINDPQILFIAIGDHIYDDAPLQIGQFESGDAEMDLWLERVYLERGGGGNRHESYPLAWYFAGNHTAIDCFEKRNLRGFIFTIGDERFHEKYTSHSLGNILNETKEGTAQQWYEQASKMYNVFHVHCRDGSYGRDPESQWKELLGENLIAVDDSSDIFNRIAETIISSKPMIEYIGDVEMSNETSTNDETFKITL